MKLLYVIHQYFPECHSGTEQYCLAAVRAARRRGDEAVVVSMHWDHDRAEPPIHRFELPYDGERVIRINHWRGLNRNDVLRDYDNRHLEAVFREIVAEVKPTAVHFFHLRQLGSNLIAVAKACGLRTVVSLTDFWFLCPRFTLLRRDGVLCDGPPDGGRGCVACEYPELAHVAAGGDANATNGEPTARLAALLARPAAQLRNLALADAVLAPSRFVAAKFAANGFPAARIQVVPYGLQPGRVRPTAVARPRRPLRLGFCGVLSPWKAAHVAVDAVRRTSAEVELTVHGRLDEPMFADYIASLRARAGDDSRIRFADAFDGSQIDRVFADTDVLVVPSTWYENTPFVVLEAFAAGVPVFASDLGGLSEIVRDGVNGRLFAAGDAAALARLIEACVADPQLVACLRPSPPHDVADDYEVFRRHYAG